MRCNSIRRIWAAGLCLAAGLTACTATEAPHPEPPDGTWLANGKIEVCVTHTPVVRIAAVRGAGGTSLLRTAADSYTGIRSQFMDPVSDERSGSTAAAPGRIISQSPRELTVAAEPREDADLGLTVRVTLDADRPVFTVIHTLTNVSPAPRRLAAWSLAAFDRAGTGYISFGNAKRPYRTVSYFHWAKLPQPSIDMGRAVAVDFTGELNGTSMKLGVHNDAGWWAYVRGHEALIGYVPHDAGATYPEGGDNITTFQGAFPDRAWAELEQVGPLREVKPGASVEMVERFALVELDGDAGATKSPDAMRDVIEPIVERLLRVSP